MRTLVSDRMNSQICFSVRLFETKDALYRQKNVCQYYKPCTFLAYFHVSHTCTLRAQWTQQT